MKNFFIKPVLLLLIFLHGLHMDAQVTSVTFKVYVPAFDSLSKGVYLAGSFNNWNAKDSLYLMKKNGHGVYRLTIPVFTSTNYYYKYCLGNWQKVELNAGDSNIANRHFIAFKRKKITDTVMKWKQPGTAKDSSEQLKKFTAMKDSLVMQLKPRLAIVIGLFKEYIENMLRQNPSVELHKQFDEKAAAEISGMYKNITQLLWNICSTLSAGQKQAVIKMVGNAGGDNFINDFLDAINKVAK